MRYQKLFSISFLHDFFTDNLCKGIDIYPTKETIAILKGHKLILKKFTGGIECLIGLQTEDDPETAENELNQPLVAIQNGTLFTFELHITDPLFRSFTDLEGLEGLPNPPAEEGLSPSLQFQNSSQASEQGLIASKVNGPSQPLSKLGTLQLSYQDFLAATDPPHFTYQFQADETNWKYYVIMNMDEAAVEYSITDASPSPSLAFSSAVDFTENPALGGFWGESLKSQHDNKRLILIESTAPVKYQEVSRKNVRLSKSGNVVISHLPNPSPSAEGTSYILL